MTINKTTVQQVIAYLSVLAGVLTSQLSAIHLPTVGSIILGIFGILLHPDTSVVAALSSKPTTPPS